MHLFAMSGVGTYALGRELGAPRATATALAACVVAVPAAAFVAFEGMPDPFMFATFTAGVLFLLRHARTHARTDLVLTGLALGLSLGSKWYAFPAVASVLAVWATTSFVAHRRTRPLGLAGPGFPGVPVVYPMFGDRLANHVEYIGPFVEGMLRPHTRRETFLQAVGKGGYDFVVVQLGSPLTRPDLARRHDRWMGESGYRPVAETPRPAFTPGDRRSRCARLRLRS